MAELVHAEATFAIIGAAMEVHRELGPGFLEGIYQRGMEAELHRRGMRFESQRRIQVSYKGESLGEHVLDLVVDDKVVVELKAVKELTEQHLAQILSYVRASRLPIGLLINFAKRSLQHRRVIFTDGTESAQSSHPRNPW
jgi:GxxExxY protein